MDKSRKERTETTLIAVRERVDSINTVYGRNELKNGHEVAADTLKVATEMFVDADSEVVLAYIQNTYKRILAAIMADILPNKDEFTTDELVECVSRTTSFIGMSSFFDGYFYREIQEEQRVKVSP